MPGLECRFPASSPPPLASARLRSRPEDFFVRERMDIRPDGEGEHVWIQLRKRGVDTMEVARRLAQVAGVRRANVGYAGLKDKNAVAEQWFSVHLPGREEPDWRASLPADMEILALVRHGRKLKRGAHGGNDFEITLRDCRGDRERLEQRLALVRRQGVPNYFGGQRFGRGNRNLDQARALFRGALRVRDRKLRGIFISAARAFLFNATLAGRVRQRSWDAALDGDVFVFHDKNSFFVPPCIDDSVRERLAAGDIHPSGPLWGAGEPPSRGGVYQLETRIAQQYPELARGLAGAGLRQQRRALRVIPSGLRADWTGDRALRLRFHLPKGCFATAVLQELVAQRDGE